MPEWRSTAQVPADHPCLAGHFPGNPIVPAVVLLEQVLAAVQRRQGAHWQLHRVQTAKFLLPLLPDQQFEILMQLTEGRVHFRCERDTQVLAQGSLDGAFADSAQGPGIGEGS